ncbi:hypothetical protein HK098_008167 [Nowakowskiella sp. JEL0407]|nr:hypothetical protein HK098_008167 [Nowakowskiella sp. JEL0407]
MFEPTIVSYQDFIGYRESPIPSSLTLLVFRDVPFPQLNLTRDVFILLPKTYNYQSSRSYPVLYMHDSQNLFDPYSAFNHSTWKIDHTLNSVDESEECIIVCIPNANSDQRWAEYGPFKWNSKADAYLSWVVDTIKPLMDRKFRTMVGRENTGIVGSSMGGLVSMYAFIKYNHVFGNVGCLSPSLWYGSYGIFGYLKTEMKKGCGVRGRVYLDVGLKENYGMIDCSRRMRDLLSELGFKKVDLGAVVERGEMERLLMFREDHMGTHSEAAWAFRFPDVLRFLVQ